MNNKIATKAIIISGVFGTAFSAIFARISNAPSMVVVLYRVLFASIILAPFMLASCRKELKEITWREAVLCFVSGSFLGLHFTFYFESLKFTSIASSVVLVNTEVFFVAFIALLIFKEKITYKGWIGIVATFIGSVVIALGNKIEFTAFYGNMLALIGAIMSAVYTLIGRACRKRLSTTLYTTLVYFAASVTVFVILTATGVPVLGYHRINILAALGMAVLCTLLGHSVFSWGLKFENASFIATSKLLTPVFSSAIAFVLFREIPTFTEVIGGILVIAGIAYYTLNEKK